MINDLIPLSSLTNGQAAHIGQVAGQVDHVHRLHELGLRHGAKVEMLQAGTPCIIRLSGHKLCFRGEDLMSVLVRPEVCN